MGFTYTVGCWWKLQHIFVHCVVLNILVTVHFSQKVLQLSSFCLLPPPLPQIRVMHQQLVFFNESLVKFYGGNLSSVEHLVKDMKEKLEGVNRDGSEWLEDADKNETS